MIKDGSIYKTSNTEMKDEGLVQMEKEVSKEDMDKLFLGATITDEGVVVENSTYLKALKEKQIEKSISPMQAISLLADCIEILAEGNNDPRLDYARAKFNDIKTILKDA